MKLAKLKLSLSLTTLMSASLFGSTIGSGKLVLPSEGEKQSMQIVFEDEFIPETLNIAINLFNASSVVKGIKENYEKQYENWVEKHQGFVNMMAKRSHSGDSYRLSRKVPTRESFFTESLERYENEGIAFFEKQAKIVFSECVDFDWVSVVMRPYLRYSFFKFVGIGGDRDLFNIFYVTAQNTAYKQKHYFVSILYLFFLCDEEWFTTGKSRDMFREVFINLLKACADRFQDEKLKECLSAEESIAILVRCGADLEHIERMNDIPNKIKFLKESVATLVQCGIEPNFIKWIDDIPDSVNHPVTNFLNAEYTKIRKAQQAAMELSLLFERTITSEITCQENEKLVDAQEEVPLTQQPVSMSKKQTKKDMSKKQMKKNSSPKTLEDLNAKFGMELKKDLSELELVIIDFYTDEEWQSFVKNKKVRFAQQAYRQGSHESQGIVFDFEGQETKGLLLNWYVHGTDTKTKGGVNRTVRITRRIQK